MHAYGQFYSRIHQSGVREPSSTVRVYHGNTCRLDATNFIPTHFLDVDAFIQMCIPSTAWHPVITLSLLTGMA